MSPPTAGYLRSVPLSLVRALISTETDEAPKLQIPQPSPFTDLGAFAPQENFGETPMRGPHAPPFASLGPLASSLRVIGLRPPHPAPALARADTSKQASGEYNFSFVGSRGSWERLAGSRGPKGGDYAVRIQNTKGGGWISLLRESDPGIV